MKKYKRKRAIAVLLTAALMIGVIKETGGLLMAVETFSGVNEIVNGKINDKKEFVILEIVDDASEASVGYLVSGWEPNAPNANENEKKTGLGDLNSLEDDVYTKFLENLRRQGLLATNDNDDQSSYPIEHRVTERKYSDESREEAANAQDAYWANFEGYRERGLTMVSGYFVPVTSPQANEVYYYYLADNFEISTMTQDELEDVAVRLMRSYNGKGYTSSDLNGGRFFKFYEKVTYEKDTAADGSKVQSEPVPVQVAEPVAAPPILAEPDAPETMSVTILDEQDETEKTEELGSPETVSDVSRSDRAVIRVSIDLDRSVLVVSTDEGAGLVSMMETGEGDLEKTPVPVGTPDPTDQTDQEDTEKTTESEDSTGPYTVSYEWGGLPEDYENLSIFWADEYTGEDSDVPVSILCPQRNNSCEKGAYYTVDAEYRIDRPIVITDNNGEILGVYSFSGWKMSGKDDVLPGESIEVTGDIELRGIWKRTELTQPSTLAEPGQYKVSYEWGYDDEKDGGFYWPAWVAGHTPCEWTKLLRGLELEEVQFKFNGETYTLEGIKEKIELPAPTEDNQDDPTYSDVIVEGKIDGAAEITLLGTYRFFGWDTKEGSEQGEESADGEEIRIGTWTYTSNPDIERICSVTYRFVGADGKFDSDSIPSNLRNGGGEKIGESDKEDIYLNPNTMLPDGTLVGASGAALSRGIQTPEVRSRYFFGDPCDLNSEIVDQQYDSNTVIEVKVNNELIGKYSFSGWTRYYKGTNENNILEISEDSITLDSDITIVGTWTYTPVSNAKYVPGYGYQYEYIKDELVNHDWFKYYVLGLDESQWNSLNIKVATYTPDGTYLLGANFGSLTEAMNRADLVVLNADGRYLVVNNDEQTAEDKETGDISVEAAKILLSRACANEQEKRLAVVVDSSVLNAKIGNMKKIAVLLQQPDIGRAYEEFTARARFEDSYDGTEWNLLRDSVASLNGGNFVRENVYFVSYKKSSFKGTTYRDTGVDVTSVFSLANADFENQYSDSSVDSGFADVYRAILNENYTRGQNSQKSMDEYVTPAVAVAYILNYRKYDPVIYKDQIRVLELEPCMDFTYYYPGRTDTDAGRKAKEDGVNLFIKDWAPSFKDKYAQNPNAVVIDGMTTAEFCGKIADVYEDYDLIYFGSNTGLLNTSANVTEWQERDSCPETIRNVKGRYYIGYNGDDAIDENGESKNTGFYSYIDGQWYVSFWADMQHDRNAPSYWIECDGAEVKDIEVGTAVLNKYNGNGGWTWAISHGNGAWEWRWNWETQKWQLRAAPDFRPTDRVVPYEWVDDTPDSYSIDRILKAQAQSTDNLKYQYKNGKWYRHPNENDGLFWVENLPIDQPHQGNRLYSRGNDIDSDWRWIYNWGDDESPRWEQKVTYSGKPFTLYNDSDMNGMVYTHIGDFFIAGEGAWYDYGGLLETETVDGRTVSRYSGNDILEWQVDELLNFLKSGSPIIVASDFMTYYDEGKIRGINSSAETYSVLSKEYRGILDTSSYVYRFVQKACDAGYFGKGLLLEKTHGSEDIAVALNQQKLRLNLFSMPEPYAYTETADELGAIVGCTYLRPESDGKYYLNYEFSITNLNALNPLTTRYDVKLFLDSNNDGIYNTATEELEDITVINAQTGVVEERIKSPMDSGGEAVAHYSLSAGTPYRVRRELPQGYVGAIGWKLTATQVGNTGIHDSAIGLTAVQKQLINSDKIDPVSGKRIINVLQIVKDSQVTLNLEDCMENPSAESDYQWKTLLESIPDFLVRFDSISERDFAYSFDYDVHPDHYCELHKSEYDEKGGHLIGAGGRDNYLNFYDYDMVILGFGDEYGNLWSKKATEALLAYGDSGKSLMYTHDTTYSHSVLRVTEDDFAFRDDWDDTYKWNIGYHTSTLSMSIRNQCGMDRFGVSVNRFNGQYNPIRKGAEIALTGQNEVLQFNSADNDRLGSDIAYKPGSGQSVMAAQTQGFTYVGMNVGLEGYANFDYSAISENRQYSGKNNLWMKVNSFQESYVENNNIVTRVNSGIITQYPYDIKEEIVVSNTHAQYFQVDLDTDWDGDGRGDIVVWYCISSLDNTSAWDANTGKFKPNDIYDYSPNDVRNNYYIYNKGNITYTGVGHDKNFTIDEMKLFINTFIAAYNAGIHDPSVRIVDGASTNAPDLESVSLPFMAEDAESAGTQRVYYQVEDHNITTGTKNLSVTYYLDGNSPGQEGGLSEVEYLGDTIYAEMYAGNPDPAHPEKKALQTYDARTGQPVSYDAIRSGRTYYIDVPLDRLLGPESFNLYVKIDLKLEGSSITAASDIDRLLISKLKMFNLD